MGLHFIHPHIIDNSWIDRGSEYPTESESKRLEARREAVRSAIDQLTAIERTVILRRYFEFQRLSEIADDIGLSRQEVLAIHNRSLRVLQQLLRKFVKTHFRLRTPRYRCCICRSPHRARAEAYLSSTGKSRPYYIVMRALQDRYGIRLASFKTVIGHMKYHSEEGRYEPSNS